MPAPSPGRRPSALERARPGTSREDMDIVAMFRPVTKYSAMVTSAEPADAPPAGPARRDDGAPGLVHLNIPVDLVEAAHEDWFDPKTYRPPRTLIASSSPARARRGRGAPSAALRGVGRRHRQGGDHLKALAGLPARVATTPRAKGPSPEPPLEPGVMGLPATPRRARACSIRLPILFAIGTSLSRRPRSTGTRGS